MKKKIPAGWLSAFLVVTSCSAPPLDPRGAVAFWSNKPDPELTAAAAAVPGLSFTEVPREGGWLPLVQAPSGAPDLLLVDLSYEVQRASDLGLLADLGPYRGRMASPARLWPGVARMVEAEKRTVFLPAAVYLWRLFYNTAVLEKAGLRPPATLPELEKAFAVLREQGTVPLALGSSFGWPALAWVSVLDLQYNGADAHRQLLLGRRGPDDPSLQAVYETLARWRDKGWVDPDSGSQNWPESLAKLAEGTAGFSLQAASAVGRLRNAPAVGSMAVPGLPGRNEKTQLAGVLGFVVRAQAPAPEAALALADAYLARGVPGQVADLFRLPAVQTAYDPAADSLKAAQAEELGAGASVVVQLDRILEPQEAYNANQVMIRFFSRGSTMTASDLATQLAAAVRGAR